MITDGSTKSKTSFSIPELKSKASGQWHSIIQRHGIDSSFLDGRPCPCPKCGGKDRWRTFEDFEETGGALCNQCGKFADGISLIQWYCDISLGEALETIANEVGVEPQKRRGSKAKEEKDPSKHLKQLAWSEQSATFLAAKKKPITLAGLKAASAVRARYRDQYPVFAIPIVGQSKQAGWCLIHATGKDLPYWTTGSKEPEWAKVKITAGSEAGLMGSAAREGETVVFKVEGVSDCLALLSLPLPDHVGVVTNAFGCGEDPAKNPWILERFRNKVVYVIHDCDIPGQDGAIETKNGKKTRPGWAKAIATVAKEVRNVVLPYPIEQSHGKDLRDWINEQFEAGLAPEKVFSDLLSMCEMALVIQPPGSIEKKKQEDDSKAVIRNFEFEVIETDGGIEKRKRPLTATEICDQIFDLHDGFPKKAAGQLFFRAGNKTVVIQRSNQLFAYLRDNGVVEIANGGSFVSKEEIFESLLAKAEKFHSIEEFDHFPRINGVFYSCDETRQGDGKALDSLISKFNPSSDVDRQMIEAAWVTPSWGGPPGQRPAFLVTAIDGQGSGKSSLVSAISNFYGGAFLFEKSIDAERLSKLLLSGDSNHRIVVIDNVKSHRLSSEALEAAITATTIAGHRMYVGHASRPNNLTYILTGNSLGLSRDLSQRLLTIVLGTPKYDPEWAKSVEDFISENREAIRRDICSFFARPKAEMKKYCRWSMWQGEVLSRLRDPEAVFEVLQKRELETDVDRQKMIEIEELAHRKMKELGYEINYRVFVPNKILHTWLSNELDEEWSTTAMSQFIGRCIDNKSSILFARSPSRKLGRGYVFQTIRDETVQITYDLERRIDGWR